MDTRQERLSRLDNALLNKQQICSSEGVLSSFPTVLKEPFMIDGVGLVICRQGSFTFILNQKSFSAKAGDTLFLPKDSLFQVLYSSADVEVFIFIYQTDPIRDRKFGSIHEPIFTSCHRTMLCLEYRRGRRSSEIPVVTGQYAEHRRKHIQSVRTKTALVGINIQTLFCLYP